jgi:phosphoribosyl 1,2-cyclic phosphodiesterase
MKVKFWGTRGSIATPGPATMKYGGNTSCVEVRAGGNILIFDAGTGIRELGVHLLKEFPKQPLTIHLFLSHTHWDHIQGFPFFPSAYQRHHEIYVYGPPGRDKSLEQVFRSQMDSDYFPVSLGDMNPNINIIEMHGAVRLGKITVDSFYLNHPAMCLGYRVTEGNHSVVYATDNEPYQFTLHGDTQKNPELAALPQYMDEKLIAFVEGTDLYIGEGQYTLEEYQTHKGWGHTPAETLVQWGLKANAKRLAMFHHDPFHDDNFIDGMVGQARSIIESSGKRMECFGAAEGMEVDIS